MKRTDPKACHTCTTLKQWFGNTLTIPPYQRGLVWTDQQRKDLIDSIINGYDIPKLYFKKSKDEKLEVIDGQQRLMLSLDLWIMVFLLIKIVNLMRIQLKK